MKTYKLKLTIELLSDTALGSGAGLAGLVDQELLYDPFGFPMANGRTVKGWMVESCADLLENLQTDSLIKNSLEESASRLFGNPGDSLEDSSLLVGDLHILDSIRAYELQEIKQKEQEILNDERKEVQEKSKYIMEYYNKRQSINKTVFTRIRHQTAIDPNTGAAKEKSLRTIRVINRGNQMEAEIIYQGNNDQAKADLPLLCATVALIRRVGKSRTRGLGKVRCQLTCATEEKFFENRLNEFYEKLEKVTP